MKIQTKEEIEKIVYCTDASQIEGKVEKVIFPTTIGEIESLIRNSQVDLVPRGAGTGLVGGAVPQNSIVVDMSKMNKILEINKEKRIAYVEAGVVLDELQEALKEFGLEFPVNPSSHAVCTIGGMIATNAVGSRAVKYGRTSDWISGIEFVDGNGELKKLGKIDLSDVSGREGITGIIVRATLKLSEIKKRTADLIQAENVNEIMEFIKKLKINNEISMVEILDKKTSLFLGLPEKYHLLLEYESHRGILDGKKYEEVMQLRDKSYPFLASLGYTIIEDPKILTAKIPEFISWLEERKIPFFGHLGVGILHPCFMKNQGSIIEEMIKFVKKLRSEITGEHGIGLAKKRFLEEQDKKLISILKKRYDFANKINRGKIL